MTSFLNKFLGRKNRTFHWQVMESLFDPLVVDLTAHRFCGAAIGEPIEKLSFLGPSENRHQQTEVYHYNKRGFYLVEGESCLETIVFILEPPTPFVGHWLCDGRVQTIAAPTQPGDVQRYMGEPFHKYTEPTGDLIWFYEFPGVEWQFAWSGGGELASIEMGIPELSSAEARTFYQVKTTWPF